MERYFRYITKDSLYHHGILGQRWGHQNGPPYPLDEEDHSTSERKKHWKLSLNNRSSKRNHKISNKKSGRIKKKLNKIKKGWEEAPTSYKIHTALRVGQVAWSVFINTPFGRKVMATPVTKNEIYEDVFTREVEKELERERGQKIIIKKKRRG